MAPAADADAVIVKTAVPPVGMPEARFRLQDKSAAADDGIAPQFTEETPVPGDTALTTTFAGNWSATVRVVGDVVVPELPMVKVYVMAPLTGALEVAALIKVRLGGVTTLTVAVAGDEVTALLSVTVNVQLVVPVVLGKKVN